MKEIKFPIHEKISLNGEVIELFEEGGVKTIKIKFKEFICEIKSTQIEELHLGDKVIVDSLLNLNSLKESFNHKN